MPRPRPPCCSTLPPRAWPVPCSSIVLERRPARIIYVSCNPATLARDIKELSTAYAVKRAKPMDMFPQTADIEVATLLELV